MSVVIKKAPSKILKGTDPEIFCVYERDGTKYALPPVFFRQYRGVEFIENGNHPIFIKRNGWKLHEDGAAFEMAIPPSFNARDLFDSIQESVEAGNKEILANFPDDCEPNLQFLPTIGWDIERWKAEGKAFYYATRFGCDPDNNAFDFNRLSPEIDAKNWPFRYSGGHIHLSGSPWIREEPILAVKCQAITSGCAAIAHSDRPDLDQRRTETYGKPGKYRVQNYGKETPFGQDYQIGIEYRTPSSRWASSWEIAEPVLWWAEIGITHLLETDLGAILVEKYAHDACTAILEADQKLAGEILASVQSYL